MHIQAQPRRMIVGSQNESDTRESSCATRFQSSPGFLPVLLWNRAIPRSKLRELWLVKQLGKSSELQHLRGLGGRRNGGSIMLRFPRPIYPNCRFIARSLFKREESNVGDWGIVVSCNENVTRSLLYAMYAVLYTQRNRVTFLPRKSLQFRI